MQDQDIKKQERKRQCPPGGELEEVWPRNRSVHDGGLQMTLARSKKRARRTGVPPKEAARSAEWINLTP